MGDVLADQAPLPGAPFPALSSATNQHGTRLAVGGPGRVAVYAGGSGAPLWAHAGSIDLDGGVSATQVREQCVRVRVVGGCGHMCTCVQAQGEEGAGAGRGAG